MTRMRALPKRPGLIALATLGLLVVLIVVALGPGRSLLPARGAEQEQAEAAPDWEAQLEDLITPPSDKAIDWGIFRVIPRGIADSAQLIPQKGPSEAKIVVTEITSIDNAKTLLPIVYQATLVPQGFTLSSTKGRKMNTGSYRIQVGEQPVTTTAFELTSTYRHQDGRAILVTQRSGPSTLPWPVENPNPHPRMQLRLGYVLNQPAIFQMNTAIVDPSSAEAGIIWGNRGVLLEVTGRLSDIGTLRQVAESIRPVISPLQPRN